MNVRKRNRIGIGLFSIWTVIAVALANPMSTKAAASPQVCTISKTCSIGEFLYDDSYAPITTGVCTFTSRYPDGSFFVNGASLTGTGDGWYAHNFTTPTTEGIYRSQICCTSGSDYLCIDKSFEARAQSSLSQTDVADAVWNSTRSSHKTSGSFGESLQEVVPSSTAVASAVWGYSGRTLSGFNSLVTDIWGSTTRTLTGTGLSSIYNTYNTTTTLEQINKNSKETRLLLEKQVNKPIIQNGIEDTANLQTKLNSTQDKAKNLYFAVAQIQKSLMKTQSSWRSLTPEDRLEAVNDLISSLGEPTDKSNSKTLFGMTTWFVDQWDFVLGKTASKNVAELYTQLKQTQSQLASGTVRTTYFPRNTINSATLLRVNIGEISDDETQTSLFSEINQMTQLVSDLNIRDQKIKLVLKDWKKMPKSEKEKSVSDLTRDVLALNRISQVGSIIRPKKVYTSDREMQNAILSLSGIIKANKGYLARSSQKSFTSTWLELGSIVFKTLVTNPSTLITQSADVKYYLPKEVKKEAILNIDDGLTLKLDQEKSQYYVAGSFELAPGESKVLSVRVTDIWHVTEAQIKSLKNQAKALVGPLEKTAYFAQGVTISSDIDVALDKIKLRQSQAETPEAKLVAYREAQIELSDIATKMDKLKDIATQASSTGTLFGFVGATQTLAVWGLIIIMSTGFIFLTIYMRKLSGNPSAKSGGEDKIVVKKSKKKEVIVAQPEKKGFHFSPKFLVVVALLIYGPMIGLASAYVAYTIGAKGHGVSQKKVLGTADIVESQMSCEPKISPVVQKVEHQYATITQTPTGWLRVRLSPSGRELARVREGESFPLVEETHSWLKIKLQDDSEGWISSRYAQIDTQKKEVVE